MLVMYEEMRLFFRGANAVELRTNGNEPQAGHFSCCYRHYDSLNVKRRYCACTL